MSSEFVRYFRSYTAAKIPSLLEIGEEQSKVFPGCNIKNTPTPSSFHPFLLLPNNTTTSLHFPLYHVCNMSH